MSTTLPVTLDDAAAGSAGAASATWIASLPTWQAVLAVLVASAAVAFALEWLVVNVARRVVRRTETELDRIVVQEVRWPLVVTSVAVGLFVVTLVPGVADAVPLDAEELRRVFGRPLVTFLVLVWAYPAIVVVNRAVEELKEDAQRLDFAPVLSNIWTFSVIVCAGGIVMHLWEVDVTPLLAGAGIAGVTVGLAAEEAVSNFFGGVALYFDDTYKVGDYIELDSGTEGTVVSVGVRSTTLRTRDEVLVTIPNAELNAAKVFNESVPGRRRRIGLDVGVGYDTDMDRFETLAVEAVATDDLVLDAPEPRTRLLELGDSALVYTVFCWVPDPNPRRTERTKHRLNRKLVQACREEGISLPSPQREVSLEMADDATGAGDRPADATGAGDRPDDAAEAGGRPDDPDRL